MSFSFKKLRQGLQSQNSALSAQLSDSYIPDVSMKETYCIFIVNFVNAVLRNYAKI